MLSGPKEAHQSFQFVCGKFGISSPAKELVAENERSLDTDHVPIPRKIWSIVLKIFSLHIGGLYENRKASSLLQRDDTPKF